MTGFSSTRDPRSAAPRKQSLRSLRQFFSSTRSPAHHPLPYVAETNLFLVNLAGGQGFFDETSCAPQKTNLGVFDERVFLRCETSSPSWCVPTHPCIRYGRSSRDVLQVVGSTGIQWMDARQSTSGRVARTLRQAFQNSARRASSRAHSNPCGDLRIHPFFFVGYEWYLHMMVWLTLQ